MHIRAIVSYTFILVFRDSSVDCFMACVVSWVRSLLALYEPSETCCKMLQDVLRRMMSTSEIYSYQRTMYFRDGLFPICRTMRANVYSRSSADWLLQRLWLLGGDGAFSETIFACGVRFWHGCDKGVDVGIAGAWDSRWMDTVLEI